jgi:hypothetical protein
MDMQFLYALISTFLHHPIGVVPMLQTPVGHMAIG